MGRAKAALPIGDTTLAGRIAALLEEVAFPALEVGPGFTGLTAIRDEPPGSGPLVAVAAGWRALQAGGFRGPVLVLACDLPFVGEHVLRTLAEWPGEGSVVPVVDGRAQPLCARWGTRDLDDACALAGSGARSLRHLQDSVDVTLIGEDVWRGFADAAEFLDVDSVQDLAELGLDDPPANPRPVGR
jgi:molybdenum cofactor guanylyltransferase